jgi:hypothetical protein
MSCTKKIFPCAIIFTKKSIEGICKDLFGTCPDNTWIFDAISDAFTNRTINFVTIGLYDMYDYFEKQRGSLKALKCIQNTLDELKAILYAVSQFVSSIIVGMLTHFYAQSENLKKYSYRDGAEQMSA